MTENQTLLERVNKSFNELTLSASRLNEVSDNLNKQVIFLESSLKKLNLGIFTWVIIARGSSDDDNHYWKQELGYAKIGAKWGIAIRTEEGFPRDPPVEPDVEIFLFNDAPRHLRLKAIEKIPDLLEKMIVDANATSANIEQKIAEVRQIALALNPPPTPPNNHRSYSDGRTKSELSGLPSVLDLRSYPVAVKVLPPPPKRTETNARTPPLPPKQK